MEDKTYEVGRVEITSTEYRDLVKEAVESARDASEARSAKWKVESERDAIKKELEEAKTEIARLKREIDCYRSAYSTTAQTTLYNDSITNIVKRTEEEY